MLFRDQGFVWHPATTWSRRLKGLVTAGAVLTAAVAGFVAGRNTAQVPTLHSTSSNVPVEPDQPQQTSTRVTAAWPRVDAALTWHPVAGAVPIRVARHPAQATTHYASPRKKRVAMARRSASRSGIAREARRRHKNAQIARLSGKRRVAQRQAQRRSAQRASKQAARLGHLRRPQNQRHGSAHRRFHRLEFF
jgi:hypothetical protein